MATVTIIQPNTATIINKVRVAAYCRVSSSSEDQLNSYQAQLTYYSHKFENSDTEELIDLYADEGITGTREDKRDEFQRLIKDCRRGKIDRIYTKSISRFARNTRDCLKNIRELKSLGITILFEKEDIDTANVSDEMMITIMGGLAQEESVSISQNMQWSIQKRMQNGTYVVSNQPFGYQKENGRFIVYEEEAAIVRRIYTEYLQGYGLLTICEHLNQDRIIMGKSGNIWRKKAVRYILTNEKYIGDCLWRKQYTENMFPFRKSKNKGQAEQYYISDNHEPIISREDFEIVQSLLAEKGEKYGNRKIHQYPLTLKVKCGICGSTFKRKKANGIIKWVCQKHDFNSVECPCRGIQQDAFYDAFIHICNKLIVHHKIILQPLQTSLQQLKLKKYSGNLQVMDIHRDIAKLREQVHVLSRLKTKGFLSEAKFQEQVSKLNGKINRLQQELKRMVKINEEDEMLTHIEELLEIFEKRNQLISLFEPDLFGSIVDKIVVKSINELEFHLIGGLKLSEII